MTKEQVLHVLEKYCEILEKQYGAAPTRGGNNFHGVYNHLLWMCHETAVFIKEGRIEKAMRWLGFIQGAFWIVGARTIDQMKQDNMPPE